MESEKASRPASLLGTLRTAVKKVRFLLSFSATRWIINSIAGRRSAPGATAPLRLSFGSRRPGLLDAEDDDDGSPASTTGPSRTVSLGSGGVSRTSSAVAASEYSRSASSGATSSSSGGSSPAGDDDIDRRAEQFIANFYKHIQMERQVSLQLRYCRVDSLQERSAIFDFTWAAGTNESSISL
ncbi:hypothetical protein VPH35_003563 [Triticum aestivum]|uniref:Uncharacterized protein n=2 Tax=Triticum TaxID=4564 RepID=A0A9R0QEC6_TRITD|nr:unnamed protein product [Triticum turgidum subsp. durum]